MSTSAAPPSTAADASVFAPGSAAANATPDTAPSGPGTVTACGLISEKEAAAALGTDPGPGQETPLGESASACTYVSVSSSLQLSMTPTGGKATYHREQAGIPPGAPGITEVSGVGDSAFSQVSGTRAAINFNKGDALVVIGLTTGGAPATQDQLAILATAAAGRI